MVFDPNAHKTDLSGPLITVVSGLMAGAGIALGANGAGLMSQTTAYSFGLSVGASALALAGFWALIAQQMTLKRNVRQLDVRLSRLTATIGQLQDELPASDSDHEASQQVTAELRILQKLLKQVVERRADTVDNQHSASISPLGPRDPLLEIPNRMPEAEALSIMRGALEDSRIDLYLQPVVRLPSRRIAHYEAFSRVRDEAGQIIFPHDYLYPAQSAGMVATLDNVLLFRCISLIRTLGPRRQGTRLFVNLALGSLLDPGFMSDFVRFMSQHGDLSGRLAFEISDADFAQLDDEAMQQLMLLSQSGFAFSIDQLESLDADLGRYGSINVQYIKMAAAALIEGGLNHDAPSFKRSLKARGIELIATHIEDERTVIEILDLGLEYGQGYLFGKPRPAREAEARAA
jgi:cyclic-di-GMP phosphodiesterase, flagellum assembly factor TipF